MKPRCDAHLPILLIIIIRSGTTKGKATPSCSRPRKPASTGPAAEYAVVTGPGATEVLQLCRMSFLTRHSQHRVVSSPGVFLELLSNGPPFQSPLLSVRYRKPSPLAWGPRCGSHFRASIRTTFCVRSGLLQHDNERLFRLGIATDLAAKLYL